MSARGWETTIGLEVHCQLGVTGKLFSPAPAAFGGEANSRVSAIDLGLPGTLPRLDPDAVELALRAALALGGDVQATSVFERKQYFYPDLPKGYQISQYERPFCVGGEVPLGDGRGCRLTRIHLEEDAGKSVHEGDVSLLDYNRAGVALIEIVTEPDLHTPADAHAMLDQLKRILQYAGVSDCDMEKGSLRVDANVSVAPPGSEVLGSKVEIKNLNSFKAVQRALEYEQRRQTALLAAGGSVREETRLWNDERGETATMRSKEQAQDYRYFPDPDLPPLHVTADLLGRLRDQLPELPAARAERYRRQLGLGERDVAVLLPERALGDYFEAAAAASGDPRATFGWVSSEVLREVHERGGGLAAWPVPAAELGALVRAVADGRLNRGAARKVLVHVAAHGGDVEAAIAALDVEQIRDRGRLAALVDAVLADAAEVVAQYRAGKHKVWHALKGQAMRSSGGRADPALLEELLRERLDA